LFLPRESNTSSTTRTLRMNRSAARRARPSGRERRLPARSGRRRPPFAHNAGERQPFPSNLPRAVLFTAANAFLAGKHQRRARPGNLLLNIPDGRAEIPARCTRGALRTLQARMPIPLRVGGWGTRTGKNAYSTAVGGWGTRTGKNAYSTAVGGWGTRTGKNAYSTCFTLSSLPFLFVFAPSPL
jgi:hypothetical protein